MSISKKLMTTGAKEDTYVDDVFSTYVYTGEGGSQGIVNGIDLASEGGLVWTKTRSVERAHNLFDTERGGREYLNSDTTEPSNQRSSGAEFNSNGFTLTDGDGGLTNFLGREYASWTFRKAPSFFDCVAYTGDGQMGRAIPHILGVKPGMVIVKHLEAITNWFVWHKDVPGNGPYGYLESDAPFQLAQSSAVFDAALMTDSTFGVGNNRGLNEQGSQYVAYVFAHDDSDEGLIRCGSYTGMATVDLGWEPQWLMVKKTNGAENWQMVDNMRGLPTGGNIHLLRANKADAEVEDSPRVNFTSTGFEITSSNSDWGSGDFIYMAVRRPNKPAEEFEPEELFAVNNAVSGAPSWVSGFPVDMNIQKNVIDTSGPYLWSRLMQGQRLQTSASSAESQESSAVFDYQNGVSEGQGYQLSSQYAWMWRRAPGFFDVVVYPRPAPDTNHNLTVPPELIITKEYKWDWDWYVWGSVLGDNKYINLNLSAPATDYTFDSSVTDKTFNTTFGGSNQPTVAYLFASVPGLCDIGTYTGNDSSVDVDCGFTNGARWFMIKKTNSSGDWYFTSMPGSLQVLSKLNETDAQVNYSSSSAIPSGFNVTSIAGNLCDDGDTYIYMAIA